MSEPISVIYATAARRDLTKIALNLAAARGNDFARSYIAGIRLSIETLSQSPKRYRVQPRYGKGIRLRPELPYHIFFQVEPDYVLIVRVLHGSRRITRRTIKQEP